MYGMILSKMGKMKKPENRIFSLNRFVSTLILMFKVIFIVILVSCQKVINIDLNSVSPMMVIEANITNRPGPYYVKISKTVNFDQTNVFPKVTGAKVAISDTLGNVDSISEISPGVYSTSAFLGIPGRKYTLTIVADGVEYKAVSTMPKPVNIDTMRIVIENEIRRSRKEIEVTFVDPAGIQNYYRYAEIVNGYRSNNYSLVSDRYFDGRRYSRNVNVNDSLPIRTGDSIVMELHSIDKATYDYFRTLRFVSGGEGLGFLSASPANPITNFNNGALGYFSAYSITSKTIIVP
jgi:hypothetical protein